MDPNEINITIHGLPASGKTTVAQLLLKALIDAGFDNVHLDDPGTKPRTPMTDRIQGLRHTGTKINIETHQWVNIAEEVSK